MAWAVSHGEAWAQPAVASVETCTARDAGSGGEVGARSHGRGVPRAPRTPRRATRPTPPVSER